MEWVELSAPIVAPQVVNRGYVISSILLDIRGSRIVVLFTGTNGETVQWVVEGLQARTKLKTLNTANLSLKSLQRHIMEQAAADGIFPAATITGTPD